MEKSNKPIANSKSYDKSLHGLAPEYLGSKFKRRKTIYNPRDSKNKLNVPLPRTNYYENSFGYSGAILSVEQSSLWLKENRVSEAV